MTIGIINYGVGNIGSIENMLSRIECNCLIINSPEEIFKVDKLILPGVGKFDYGMSTLIEKKFDIALKEHTLTLKKPILGICLGAQLMLESSEEGNLSGLGFFEGTSKNFSSLLSESNLKIPHMGWCNVSVNENNCELLSDNLNPSRFYFVHSYYMTTKNESDIMLTSVYGSKFIAGLHRDNIYAVQFHPEKSHKYGLKFLENFVKL